MLSLNHPSQCARWFIVGNKILCRRLWSVPLTKKTFALFCGLDWNNSLFGGFKHFEVLVSSIREKKKYILLWRVKHYFWYSWWRSSVSVVCLCKAAGSSVMGQWDAVLQLWPGKTEALLFISTPIMILDQKLLFTYWFLVSCITSTRLFTIVPFTVRFHTSPVTVLPQHHSTKHSNDTVWNSETLNFCLLSIKLFQKLDMDCKILHKKWLL